MRILFISRLYGQPWAGPTYSVPKQIEAQNKVDDVLWFNIVKGSKSEWRDTITKWKERDYYLDLDDVSSGMIINLPKPFDNPDLVVVEQCYPFAISTVLLQLLFHQYNYILVPRGEFTKQAQKKSRLKKTIANALIYKLWAKKACAIQYLTQDEADTSHGWNNKGIILPNGTVIPEKINQSFNDNKIECIFIGRISVFHKGIDLLIEACEIIKEEMKAANCTIDIYGPDRENKVNELKEIVLHKGLDQIIHFHDGVYGIEKDKIIRNADCFIMTSRFEGHPTSLLEALSYGKPCLVTNGSHMRKEIEHAKAGWGADNTVESISIALKQMVNDCGSFAEKGRNARLLANRYSWDAIAQKSHIEYEKLLGERNNG